MRNWKKYLPGTSKFPVGIGIAACLLATSLLAAGDHPLHIYGLTLDLNERPAGDVEVEVIISDMRFRRPIGRETTRSTGLGEFHFDLTDKYGAIPRLGLDFRTSAPRFRQTTFIHIAAQDEFPVEVVFKLPPGISASGQVLTEDGHPVTGATINGGDDRHVQTDDDGRFVIYGLLPDRRNAIRVSGAGIAGTMKVVETPESGSMEGLVITVPTSTKLGGIVFDPMGDPVNGGLITATLEKANRFWREHLGPNGEYEFGSIPLFSDEEERLILRAWSPGYLDSTLVLNREDIDIDKPHHLKLESGVNLLGTVMDDTSSRLGGGKIVLGDGRRTRRNETPVDEIGIWQAGPVHPGETVTLTAIPPLPREGSFVADVLFHDDHGEIERWNFGPSSRLEVETREDNGIRFIRRDHGPGATPGRVIYEGTILDDWQRIEGTVTVERTGSTGTFVMRPHHGGRRLRGDWELRETLRGGSPLAAPTQQRLQVSPMEGTQVIRITLDKPGKLRGTVVDESGRTLRTGYVRLQEWNRTYVYHTESAIAGDCTFLLDGLPRDGVLTLQILDSSRTPIASPVYLRSGLEDVVLHAGASPEDPTVEWQP